MQSHTFFFLLQLITCIAAPVPPGTAQAATITLIKEVINLFPILVDSHTYTEFGRVFTQNATANLQAPGGLIFHGVPEISEQLSGLANVSSQHGFTTQYVNVLSPTTANATTYLFANFFGQGDLEGQLFTEYGIYTTDMLLTASGWRINYMLLTTKAQTGNPEIPFPPSSKA